MNTPKPFVKHAGGKSRLLPEVISRIPEYGKRFFDPFVGGGSVTFGIMADRILTDRTIAADANLRLINTFLVVQQNVNELIEEYTELESTYNKTAHYGKEAFYYKIVNLFNSAPRTLGDISQAARYLFLNRTCFNGLFRENSRGDFNVSFGKRLSPSILNVDNLLNCSRSLASTEIRHADFAEVLADAKKGDVAYLDPPYESCFSNYTASGFNLADHKRLRDICIELTDRGVLFLLSNSCTPTIVDLYQKHFKIEVVTTRWTISRDGNRRPLINELLISNYDHHDGSIISKGCVTPKTQPPITEMSFPESDYDSTEFWGYSNLGDQL